MNYLDEGMTLVGLYTSDEDHQDMADSQTSERVYLQAEDPFSL